MKKDQYLKIRKEQKEIKNLLRQILIKLNKKCDCIGQQMQAVEEVHGFGAPSIPYNPDNYCLPPDTKDDTIFKSEEEVFGPLKKNGRSEI